jgi:hypothetical protein
LKKTAQANENLTEVAPQSRVWRAWSAGRRTRIAFCLGLVGLLAAGGAILGLRSARTMRHEQILKALGAEYRWNHDLVEGTSSQSTAKLRQSLANYLGPRAVSELASVKLHKPDLEDGDLEFLSGLRQLKTLELQSDRATDQTLNLISKLPDLRYLALAGNQFSIFGLLQLRNMQNLRELDLDTTRLTPIELATLRSALAGVVLRDLNEHPENHLLQPSIATEPAA